MIKKLRQILIIGICLLLSAFQTVTFAENVKYNWNTIDMGGGGFMTGYLFHPAEEGLEYARGDVGGIWRFDETTDRWISLSNGFGIDKANYYGGAGFAIDPQNPDVIYAAVGKISSHRGDVLKSTDRGATWEATGLNKAFSANADALKGFGECIAVDPVNSNIVYVATYNDGLYVSTNAGDSWAKETGLSVSDTAKYKVRCLLFDTSANSQGDDKTQRIYASVQSKGLYLSADGGENWVLLAGSPENILRMDIANDGTLYAASQTGLFKYDGSAWTDCSYNNIAAEYRGVAVDPENPDFVVAVYLGNNIMRLPVIYSEDGGESWACATNNISLVQNTLYLEENNFSSNTSFVEMDPFNPKHIVIGDWFGLWETEDITSVPTVTWQDKNEGIEQMCAIKIATHPENPYAALVTSADNDGFPIENLEDKAPRKFSYVGSPYGGKRFMVSSDIDICEDDANYVVRIGLNHELLGVTSYSEDGGENWKNFTVDPLSAGIPDERQWSKIRFSSNVNEVTGKPSSIVVIRDGEKSLYSKDFGETWNEIDTLPEFNNSYLSTYEYLDKDYVLDDTFYCFGSNGYLYRSTNGGESWERRAYFNKYANCELKAAPDMAGEVWLLNGMNDDFSGGVLYRSSDGLGKLRVVSSITDVVTFGFGKEAPGRLNPTVYAYGRVDGICGIYRSLDMGVTWDRIDDEKLPVGNSPRGLSGSRKEFGTVFIATGGSGVFYGKTTGDDYALEPFTPEVFVPKNSVDVSVIGQNAVVKGSVLSGQSGERGTLMIFNPGCDVTDFGEDNAVQYQGEFVTGGNGEFTAVVPLNFDSVEDDEASAYYFNLYLDAPSFTRPETRTFYAGEKSFDDPLVNSYSENGLTFSVSSKGTKVEIAGALASKTEGKSITLLVMNPEKEIDNWGDSDLIQNQAECITDSDGNFKINFEINTDTPDVFAEYPAFIKGQGTGNPIEFKIPLITQVARDNAMVLLNSSNETNVSVNLNNAADILLFGVEDILSEINSEGLENKVLDKIPFSSENEAKEWLETQILLEALTQGKTQLLTDNNGLLKYADELDISTMDLFEGLTVYDTYTTKLTDSGKAGVMNYLSGKTYQDTQAVRKEFAKAVVIEAIRNYSINGYGHINGLLTTNGAYVGLVLTNYTGDTSAKDNELLTAKYDSLSDIQTVLNKTTTTDPGGDDPSDEGGSTGGGGGRDYSVAPEVIEKNEGVVPEINQEPIYFINDVAKDHWAAEAINEMLKKNIISMPEDGRFRPEDFVTREEFVKLLALTFKLPDAKDVKETFDDVPSSRWSAPYVYAAHSAGIVQGTGESTFGAEGKLTRQDMATIIYRTFKYCGLSSENEETDKFFDDEFISEYAREAIYSLYAQGTVNGMGDGNFAPLGLCTRAQAAKVLYAFTNKSTDN